MSDVSWCDYDNDGNIDLLVSGNDNLENQFDKRHANSLTRLYRNSGAPDYTFTEQTGILLKGLGFSTSKWGDYNNDGWPDLLMAGYADSQATGDVFDNNYYLIL